MWSTILHHNGGIVQISDISVKFEDVQKADHILKSFDKTLFVVYKLSETEDNCQVVS